MEKVYDIVVYGASGFTGQYVAAEMARTCSGKKMAISGRNETKLRETLKFIEQELGTESDISIIIADSNDEDSIMEMCRQSKVVVNCVGPFRWYGEQVVRCCVKMSSHYLDISGEPEFLQMCQIKYHDEAKEKGIHIVGACGLDSIPADVGLEILREKFPGELTAAESYLHLMGSPNKANYGTYNTIIQSLANSSQQKAQQKLIFKGNRLPYVGPKYPARSVSFSQSEGKWVLPFKGADPSVVRRTQLYESSVFQKTPVQYSSYITVSSFLHVIGVIIFAINIFIFTKFKLGIKLLQTFPRFFTFGVFSKDGVSKELLYKKTFKIVFYGQGFSEKRDKVGPTDKPDRSISLKISGPEGGYIFTSIGIIAGARTLLDDELLNKGGVLTPGSAFKSSGYVDRLVERGVKIEVM